jgi:uncharacterized cupin superfamily protein
LVQGDTLPAHLFERVWSPSELSQKNATRGPDYLAIAISRGLGLERCGINQETIEPGGRSSMPHAHSHEEEFVYVLGGTPTLWLDGYVKELDSGDCAAFPAGTGIAHTFLNDSVDPIQILIVGIHDPEDRVFYPLNPERAHPRPWTDTPKRRLGPHNGQPGASSEQAAE